VFLLRRLVERAKELAALGYGYLQALLGFLARLAFPDEPFTAPVRHNASILSVVTFNHERRLDRALYHLERIKAERNAWREENPHRFWPELDAESGKKVIWAQVIKPPPASLGPIAGDCIHNLRAALDNLAYELAIRHYRRSPLPGRFNKRSEFPIFGERKWTPRERRDKIGCIHPRAQAIIKRLQPHNRGNGFRGDRLWQLNELEVVDKHRFPHVATLNNLSALSHFEPGGIGIEEIETLFRYFDESAPIAQYPAFDSTGAEVSVDFKAAFDVCFSEGVPDRLLGNSIPGTLEGIHRYIVNRVLPPLREFLTRH